MRFARHRNRTVVKASEEDLNVVPMLDVIFNLLFFFMMGTTFRTHEGVFKIRIPNVSTQAPTAPTEHIPIVGVSKEGEFSLDGTAIGAEALLSELKNAQGSGVKKVVLSADAEATVQKAVSAAEIIHKAGIEDILQRVDSRPAP